MNAFTALSDHCFVHRQRYGKYRRDFQRIFGCNLKTYWDNLTGLDLCAFDEKVICSGDECMKDVVQKKFGDEGIALVLKLIG